MAKKIFKTYTGRESCYDDVFDPKKVTLRPKIPSINSFYPLKSTRWLGPTPNTQVFVDIVMYICLKKRSTQSPYQDEYRA